MLNLLMKIYCRQKNKKGRKFKHSHEEVEKYLYKFPEPIDDIERSYYQFVCQRWEYKSIFLILIENLSALFLYIPFLVVFRIKSSEKNIKKYDAVITHPFLKNYLPRSFTGSYISEKFETGSLDKNDIKFLWNMIKRHPFSFFFNFKNMCRIASYSYLIDMYDPKIVFCSAEYSFTSSILTYYCELRGIYHINLMHGEKQFNPREAFCRFTKFYVWDEYYISLFDKLRAGKSNFEVQNLVIPISSVNLDNNHYTYYLQLHTEAQLIIIKNTLDRLNKSYHVRPHPVYSNELVEKIFGTEHIENNSINIWDSIKNAGTAISQDSTVLYQAYLSGVPIVIDDISDREYYSELKQRGYIMLNKPHQLLSNIK